MKTTLEIPDPLFRRAKSVAARDGKSLKQFVNEALVSKLDEATKAEVPGWRKLFGSLKAQRTELRKVAAAVADEFETIDEEDWT